MPTAPTQASISDGTIPYGQLEGLACLQIPYEELNPANASSLATLVHRKARTGQPVIQITGVVPWGSLELDRALLHFQSDPRVDHLDVWVLRDAHEENWPTPSLWTCLDLSGCFGPHPTRDLIRNLDNLPLIPRPEEILVLNPAEKALQDTLLDEIFSRLDPAVGWIYTSDPDTYDKATRVAARCFTRWGVRWHNE